ncbi:putative isomerase [Ancylomarina subtilis]|uniref:Putative isomerase n=1 Tax=Ancylomarina subtilis TaxID=1639035 RepID=A0A4Q7VHB0_9BACT|nr:trehalase family glycosidase [Ancylomarina subtilis]RZT95472.1 putative isomerase [Ancylomarina subtilis]
MTSKNITLLLLALLFWSACQPKTDKIGDLQEEMVNILNIQGIPQAQYELAPFGFSDLGAWHGYALPHIDSTSYYGGFSGPLTMKMWGQWLSKNLCQLELTDAENMTAIDLSKAQATQNYKPGKLEQNLDLENLNLKLSLIFVSERTALVQTLITNKSEKTQSLFVGWKGELFPKGITLSETENGLKIDFDRGDEFFLLHNDSDKSIQISPDKHSYQMFIKDKLDIASGEALKISLLHSYYFNQEEAVKETNMYANWLNQTDKLFADNKSRWNGYLKKALNSENPLLEKNENRKLAVKCVQTLLTNWRSAAGDLNHAGVFPSAAYQGFYGFWSWDSWKQAVALVRFNPELAKSNLRSMFQYQDEMGMVADCVYFDSKENNWRDTKAPLASWAVLEIYKATSDLEFVKEIYPKLVKYHNWWYQYRDNDKNGLCEYGSTDGSLIAAKWESGMDNAVRFDDSKMLKNNENGWSMNQESVDLNAYLQAEKEDLAELAKLIGRADQAKTYKQEATELKQRIAADFWDEATGFFYDREIVTGKLLTVQQGPEGWIPLYTGIATKEQAKRVVTVLMDSTKFATKVPFPTLVADHKKFNPLKGYWRGPVWLDQAYFGIKGLERYGYQKEADQLSQKLLHNTEGLLDDAPIRENYHPISGKGLNANHFSWSAAHYLMLLSDKHN